MTDNPFPFLNDDWMKLQENYWKAWTDLDAFKPGFGMPNLSARDPWNLALDQWWRAVSPTVPTTVQDFFDHLVEQGKGFFTLSENLVTTLTEMSNSAGSLGEWRHLLETSFEDMKTAVGTVTPNGHETLGQMLSFWELPMDNWQRTASVMSGLPGDFLQPYKSLTLHQQAAPVREHLNKFLSVPGVGYSREHQEQHQKFFQLLLDYQTAFEAYGAEYAKIAAASVEHFRGKLMRVLERQETIDTLQGLFDLWVDACEEAYAERVFSDEYAKVHGRLVNNLMAVKKQGQALVDETLGMLNVPTKEDVATMQEGFQELRRELRAVKSQLGEARRKSTPAASVAARPKAPARPVTRKKVAAAPKAAKKIAKKSVRSRAAKPTSTRQKREGKV